MSKIGKLPIDIPEGVTVEINNRKITVKGIRGTMERIIPDKMDVKLENNQIIVSIQSEAKAIRAMYGTLRALIFNMVHGVSQGWEKRLELVGTGYRAELSGKNLVLNVGFSHPVIIEPPEGISFKVEKTEINVEGVDKEIVGLISANIRMVRPPEPYKGKGIRYKGEQVRRKAGKTAKAAGSA
ncbi:50S ribosomal protein L6 [Candidatus Woesebacteria bacterium]|nr:MAG: 50S ribosomal protein L6 [Candidatus Woesebacteria bacterium]